MESTQWFVLCRLLHYFYNTLDNFCIQSSNKSKVNTHTINYLTQQHIYYIIKQWYWMNKCNFVHNPDY